MGSPEILNTDKPTACWDQTQYIMMRSVKRWDLVNEVVTQTLFIWNPGATWQLSVVSPWGCNMFNMRPLNMIPTLLYDSNKYTAEFQFSSESWCLSHLKLAFATCLWRETPSQLFRHAGGGRRQLHVSRHHALWMGDVGWSAHVSRLIADLRLALKIPAWWVMDDGHLKNKAGRVVD